MSRGLGDVYKRQGKYLAQRNADFLVSYMAKLSAELKGDYETRDDAVIQMFATHQ